MAGACGRDCTETDAIEKDCSFDGASKEVFDGDWCSVVYSRRDTSTQHVMCSLP